MTASSKTSPGDASASIAPAPNAKRGRADAPALPLTPARARKAAAIPANPALPPYRMLPIDSLVPYENNARQHPPETVDMLARMITRFGWTNPVLIDAKRGILAGHGRVLAARQLGMDAVPTIELSHLSAAERRAYIIADNKSAEASSFDTDLLRMELGELRDDGFDLDLVGFDSDEINRLFGDVLVDDVAEPLEATSGHTVACPECGHKFSP